MSVRFLRTAKCSGVRRCSNRLIWLDTKTRVVFDEPPHQIGAIERDRREDGRLGAARQQEFGDLPAHLLEAGRPADHVHLVFVALAIDVCAGVDQPLHDIEVAVLGGPVQRAGAVEPVALVHVKAEPQQQFDAVELSRRRRRVQQRYIPSAAGDADLARDAQPAGGPVRSASPLTVAAMIWPSRLNASTCALSARQLLKP